MERYLKHRGWDDEWQGKKITSNPDLIDMVSAVSVEQLCDHMLATHKLCEHQLRSAWNYYGDEPGMFNGVMVRACVICDSPQHRVEAREIPA
jgi:hypothetical protein